MKYARLQIAVINKWSSQLYVCCSLVMPHPAIMLGRSVVKLEEKKKNLQVFEELTNLFNFLLLLPHKKKLQPGKNK